MSSSLLVEAFAKTAKIPHTVKWFSDHVEHATVGKLLQNTGQDVFAQSFVPSHAVRHIRFGPDLYHVQQRNQDMEFKLVCICAISGLL